MDLINIAAKLFLDKIGGNNGGADLTSVISALTKLLPTTDSGDINIESLVSNLMQSEGGLASIASSWLSDGANNGISVDQLLSVLGASNVENFASEIGIDSQTASNGLTEMLPELIDKNSEGGSISSDLTASLARGVLGKLF